MRQGQSPGYTLVEVIVSVALLVVLALFVAPLFHMSQVVMTTNDARALLKQQSQNALQRMASNLREARRIYCRQITAFHPYPTPPDVADFFSSTITLSGPFTPITGTRLPLQTQGTNDYVGNALFFAKQLPSADVLAGGQNFRIDLYQFYYYFVAETPNDPPVANQPTRQLFEWRSVTYADASQINQIPLLNQAQAIINLRARGIQRAHNISLIDFTNAFFELDSTGQMNLESPPHIRETAITPLTRSSGGRVFSNFRLGVCPNTSTLGFPAPIQVPQSSGWTALSPSGFEVQIPFFSRTGQRGNTLIQIHLVLAASGPIEKPILQYQDDVAVNIRDIW